MEPDDKRPDIDPLLRQAIGWLVRLKSGEATAAEGAEFVRWRKQSAKHEAALKQAVKLWQMSEKAVAGLSGSDDETRPSGAIVVPLLHRPSTRRALLGGAIAAAVAYFVVRPPLDLWPSLVELSADYRTGKGGQLKLTLAPDISLQLGTLTSVAVNNTPLVTTVELIDGEAAINANTAPGRELVVIAAGGEVTASRADFDARCVDGIVSVTCAQGALHVRVGTSRAQLGAGQQISYSSGGLGSVRDIDAAQVTSWRQGVLIFKDEPLSAVVKEINRYRYGRIFIINGDLAARVINGTFRPSQLDNFVSLVKQLFGAKVTELPGGVTLLS
jgi:transmembrane sensor